EVAARSAVWRDRSRCGEQPLRMTRRLAPLDPPLPLAGRLMGVLRAVVQIAVLTRFDPRPHLARRRAIAWALVRDDDPRDGAYPVAPRTADLLRGGRVPTALYQEIEPLACRLDGPPPMGRCAVDRQQHLVQVPWIAWSGTPT